MSDATDVTIVKIRLRGEFRGSEWRNAKGGLRREDCHFKGHTDADDVAKIRLRGGVRGPEALGRTANL